MDDTAQSPQPKADGPLVQTQSAQQTVSQPPVQQPGASPAPVSQTPTEPVVQAPPPVQESSVSVPVGGKEQESLSGVVQASHPEIILDEKVVEAGVETHPNPEVVELTPEQQQLGIEPAKEATPVPTAPTAVTLPGEYKAPKGFFGLLHQQVKNAATWLYLLLFKVEQQKSLRQDKEQVEKKI